MSLENTTSPQERLNKALEEMAALKKACSQVTTNVADLEATIREVCAMSGFSAKDTVDDIKSHLQ
jgi:hypothetical protein